MLRRTTYHFLSLLILSLWVISCQTTPDSVVQTLSLVEKCMEVAPDSALNLLKRIPNPDVLHGKAQADYSLLMTQAMDKNYIKPESDSLIAIAVGYYGSHDENWIAKGKAFFYYGRVMKELNRPEDAMRYYLKARSIRREQGVQNVGTYLGGNRNIELEPGSCRRISFELSGCIKELYYY